MRLQNLIIPKAEICAEQEMYYRYSENLVKFSHTDNVFVMSENTELHADTYFNSFSYDKWKKYTKIKNVFLEIEMLGNADVVLYQMQFINGSLTKKIVNVQEIRCEKRQLVRLDFKQDDFLNGVLAFKIRSYTDGTKFYGGGTKQM